MKAPFAVSSTRLGRAVGAHRVRDRAHEDVVVVEQPLEEGAHGRELGGVAPAAAQARHELAARAPHVREVVHGQEDRLQQREHLVLDPPHPLPRGERLDLEAAVALAAPLLVRRRRPRRPAPTAGAR